MVYLLQKLFRNNIIVNSIKEQDSFKQCGFLLQLFTFFNAIFQSHKVNILVNKMRRTYLDCHHCSVTTRYLTLPREKDVPQ